ncbi:glycosyltransferase family 2 protein [Homoserinimonas sp. OAct 916]|uniref:glycosyltransferase family 2 protein n=1 Tax=Homoserinimonas sp. OAct 916 TaxID=2211450 RepID=UPI000DBE8A26|nr:glycosyltransferase family 2 protein [Homoserinimonas sp. OAct 916]
MKLSVVVPCFNEEASIQRLVDVLTATLSSMVDSFEVILVDDGSRDGTLDRLRTVARRDDRFRYLSFSRNFGKEAAILAGLSEATGDAVAVLDADLQHPPALLAEMLPFLDRGYDQVVAVRTRTGDPAARTLASRLYYRLVNRMVDVKFEDGVGDFRVLSRKATNSLLALREYNRFSKGLFSWIGFATATVDYENVTRETGESKWGFRTLLNYGIDGILSFNSRPLRAAIHVGLVVMVLGVLYAAWVVVDAIISGVTVSGYVTTISAVVLFGGLQMILLGIIGEYLGRIYLETKARPHYILQEVSTPVTGSGALTEEIEARSTCCQQSPNMASEKARPTISERTA